MDRWIEIQDIDAPEVRYVFIGARVREDGAYQVYKDRDGRYYFVLCEEEKESDVALEVQTSRVFRGDTIAALRENKSFQEWWAHMNAEEKPEWPPEILRD